VADASTPKTLTDGTPLNYGYMWWTMSDGNYYATGIFGQFIYINPSERVVIVVWSAQSKPTGASAIDARTFFTSVVAALR
jgi:CubicO group peptidase (beta-lactamase class C family)